MSSAKTLVLPALSQTEMWAWQPLPVRPCERLRHEGGAQPVLFGDRLHHELEEGVLVGGGQRVVEAPVHLELAVGVLVVVLVGAPAERQHVVADLGDHVVAAHHRLLVVAGLRCGVVLVGDRLAVGRDQEELGLDAGLHAHAVGRRFGDQPLQRGARRLRDRLVLHDAVGGDPGDLRLPRQLDDRGRVGNGQHVGMRRRQVEPGREAGEAGAVLLHVGDRLRRHQLGALPAEQVGVGDHEIFDAVLLRECGEIVPHRLLPHGGFSVRSRFSPVSSWCRPAARRPWRRPRSSARTRSSGSRLWTWFLPQARAIVCASSVITLR